MSKWSAGPADFAFPHEDVVGDPLQNRHPLTVSDFVVFLNQTLEYAYSSVVVTGEVASFKVNQGKWVFFDIKDEETSVPCFMTLWAMRQPLEDGMKVVVRGTPKITKWGKFSLTVEQVQPVGEGSLKKAYELLKKKLKDEGLFDVSKKRGIPEDLTRLGVISSTQAAGYADFIKIVNARWGGMKIMTAHTQVQGLDAADQIVRALQYFNERGEVQMIAILRGGGSKDDLACFNDEKLVRAIAASKIPVITGIGHEIDESLADLAADVRASTPSNAAELLTRDKKDVLNHTRETVARISTIFLEKINREKMGVNERSTRAYDILKVKIANFEQKLKSCEKILEVLNPEKVLKQGYAIVAGKMSPGEVVKITTFKQEVEAEVKKVKERN